MASHLYADLKMLPIITLIFVNCLLDATSSPVYNMQPAYITANIGTTGRNIRNLPCISRKTNQSGVCMFAIDCLKANGTHLGTCIDRFYFGSCCHVAQTHEILDNSIDSSIFPEREPPLRISSTERTTSLQPPAKTTITLETKEIPTILTKLTTKLTTTSIPLHTSTTTSSISTTPRTKTTSLAPVIWIKEPTETTELSYKLTTFQSINGVVNDITTLKPISYTKPTTNTLSNSKMTSKPAIIKQTPTVSSVATTIKSTSTPLPLVNKSTSSKPSSIGLVGKPTSKPSAVKPTITPVKPLTPKPAQKPSTNKPTNKPASNKPTSKPVKITTKPVASSKPSGRPTQKPVRPRPTTILKPITRPTNKPSVSTRQPTTSTHSTTKRPILTTRISTTKITKRPTVSKISTATAKPITKVPTSTTQSTTSRIETTISKRPSPVSIIEASTPTLENNTIIRVSTKAPVTEKFEEKVSLTTTESVFISSATPIFSSFKPEVEISDKPPEKSTTESNDIVNIPLNISSNPAEVSGNIATNEIESIKPPIESTTKPTLVTWMVTNEELTSGSFNTTDEDWVPITTPDGWVLLPSVPSITSNGTFSSSTSPATTAMESISSESNYFSTDKIPETAFTSTPNPEVSTKETNHTLSATDSLETTSIQVEVNISESDISENLVNMSDFTDVCGRRLYPKARIVGGENSSFGKWPWQISLRQWRTSTYLHKCGAALLNENWAITAAHCVDSVPPSDLLLRLGEHDLSTESEPYLHQERRVQIVASHPQFDPRTFEYDLALLRFYEPVKFQPNILPVCVPQTDEDFIGRTAYVTGWGRLYEDGPLPSILQEVSVPVINNTLCESMYRSAGYIEHIPHIFICAGWRRGGFDSCEGDSGGPMVIQRSDKRFLLAGVISWGIGCAEPNQPGVYTRISEFRDWINQILQF